MKMSSDSEDEDFVQFGNALDPFDEDSLPKRKKISDQFAKDKHGRRRFHGAFTGGFTVGFLNSVGSLEGWSPAAFKSSRSEKAQNVQQKPEDFMDEEDMGEFGIAPRILRPTVDFNDPKKKRERSTHISDGPIPGTPVLSDLLQATKDTVGIKLLKKMGWKQGQGIGPRVTKKEKVRMKEDYKKTGAKVYGCSLSQDMNQSVTSDEDDNDCDIVDNSSLTFAPDDFELVSSKPKTNCFGLGYTGLDKRPILSSHINLFEPTPLRIEEKKKKLHITGQAFGVGALEEEDEDIYAQEDMSQYDFSVGKPSSSQKKQGSNLMNMENYIIVALEGFVLGTNASTRKKYFPPPLLPQGFQPFHITRKSRFDSPNNKTESQEFKKRGLQRHSLTANDRSNILNTDNNCRSSAIEEETRKLSAEALKITENLEKKEEKRLFRPFSAIPEKQQRYEQYLALCKLGQKDRLSYFQPLTMTEWEKEHERVEFEQAALLYQPLTGAMSDRFVSASELEDLNSPLPAPHINNDQKAAAKLKMFGQLTREETDWRPCSLLCKRFNIPELHPGCDDDTSSSSLKKSQFSVFNFLDSLRHNAPRQESYATTSDADTRVPQTSVSESTNKLLSTLEVPEISIKQELNTELNENTYLEFPDPPAKIDLFKAIFLSSSEDSDDDNKDVIVTKELAKHPGASISITGDTILQETILEKNIQRNTSPPRGIFANLDLDAINNRKKDKQEEEETKTCFKNEESDNQLDKIKQTATDRNHVSNEGDESHDDEGLDAVYGPKLPSAELTRSESILSQPSVKLLSSTSKYEEWVEKTKSSAHKHKHKKSSKHKKHKSKHKKKKH